MWKNKIGFSSKQKLDDLKEKVFILELENNNLSSRLSELEGCNLEAKRLSENYLNLKKCHEQCEENIFQLGQRNSQDNGESKRKINQLEIGINERDSALTNANSKVYGLEKECCKLKDEILQRDIKIEEIRVQLDQHKSCTVKFSALVSEKQELKTLLSSAEANLASMKWELENMQRKYIEEIEYLKNQLESKDNALKKEWELRLQTLKDQEKSVQNISMNNERDKSTLVNSLSEKIKNLEIELKKANDKLLEASKERTEIRDRLMAESEVKIDKLTFKHEQMLADKELEIKKAHMNVLDIQKQYSKRLEEVTALIRSEVDEVKKAYNKHASISEEDSTIIINKLYDNFHEVLEKQQKMLNEAKKRERLMTEALRRGQFDTFYNEQEEFDDQGAGVQIEEVFDE